MARYSKKKLTKSEADALIKFILIICMFGIVMCIKLAKVISGLSKAFLKKLMVIIHSILRKSNYKKEEQATMDHLDMPTLWVSNESMIDITDQWEKLPVQQEIAMDMKPNKYTNSKYLNIPVPFWEHRYIYSYDDLFLANTEQKAFYMQLRACFFSQKYVNIGENSNYAFILLFDLLRLGHKDSKNLKMLEENIFRLIEYYPITKAYALKGLIKKMQMSGLDHNIQKVRDTLGNHYQLNPEYYGMRIKLGDKFKKKLALFDSEVKLLNRIPESFNVFLQTEFCYIAVIKFYLLVIKQMNKTFKISGTSLDAEFKIIADIDFHKRKENSGIYEHLISDNYKYLVESSINHLYKYVMYHCEVAVRDSYAYNRKLPNNFKFPNIKEEVTTRIDPVLTTSILSKISEVIQLNDATEIELNKINPTRWKPKFNEILNSFSKDVVEDWYLKVVKLAELYTSTKQAKVTIYFESFKHIAKFDKMMAVKLYLLYLNAEDKNVIKPVPKAIQKILFSNESQLNKLEEIKSKLICNELSLEDALQSMPDIYAIKRKKITLDKSQVEEIHKQHLDTAQLLDEYLSDEITKITHSDLIDISDEIPILNTAKAATPVIQLVDSTLTNLKLNQVQCELIKLFANSNFVLSVNELENFATNKKAFKNSLIEGINETCYDTLDDLLIEELDDSYSINLNYYKRIFTE